MDDLLPKLLSFPPHPPPQTPLSDSAYDDGIKSQIASLKHIKDSRLLQNTSGGESTLDVINPSLNTVPYIFILQAHLQALAKGGSSAEAQVLFEKATAFLGSFDPRQVRYLGSELQYVVEQVVYYAQRSNRPQLAIPPLRDTILRLQPSGALLTPLHLLAVQIALESRTFAPVFPLLDRNILFFPGVTNQPKPKFLCDLSLSPTAYITTATGLTRKLKTEEVLEYFINCALIYIGARDWERARVYLENAITYPLRGDAPTSKIMVEAYKKWVLIGLLIEGKAPTLPRWTSGTAAKQFHILAKPYDTLAQLFQDSTALRLKQEIDYGATVWQNDCNTGLVLNVSASYQQFQVKNLGNIYTKISIPEIYEQTYSAETGQKSPDAQHVEDLVRQMISRGALQATLSNDSPAVLTFDNSGPALSEAQMQRELAAATARISNLTNEIKTTDRLLTHDKEYIRYYQKHSKNKDTGPASFAEAMDWKEEEDEDLFGGNGL